MTIPTIDQGQGECSKSVVPFPFPSTQLAMIRQRAASPTNPDTSSTSSLPIHSSRTLTVTQALPSGIPQDLPPSLLLREGIHTLQGESPVGRSVTWSEDVIDNEDMGRKKSNVCCIFRQKCEHEAMNAYEQQ